VTAVVNQFNNKMKHINLIYLAFISVVITTIFAFKPIQHVEKITLPSGFVIQPLIDNEGTPTSFIRTLKLTYDDKNIKHKINDSTYHRCAFETRIIFYSVEDSLVLNSESRYSCIINSYFNLSKEEIKWLEQKSVYYIKVINLNTDYEVISENIQPRYFNIIFFKHNKIK
jgi:hypothetical protein